MVAGTSLAPELHNGDAYDFKVDTWSYGVILYKLLTGKSHCPALEGVSDRKAIVKIYKEYKPDVQPLLLRQVSAQAMDLVQKCLVVDPGRRITMSAALKHGWFKTI